MFLSRQTRLNQLTYRINLLRARGEEMNKNLINKLIREKKKVEQARAF